MDKICMNKKIGLLGCIMTSMGAIIGAGIFGALPVAINTVGHGVVLALIASVIYILAQSVPNMYSTSVIPASGSFFLWATKIIHPSAGFFMAFLNLLQPLMIGVFAILFADYFVVLIPSASDYKSFISLSLLFIYAIIAWFGNYTFIKINSIFVLLLIAAMSTYIFCGIGAVDIYKISPIKIIRPGITLTSFGTAIGVLFSTLSGGGTISQISENIKDPRRTIPITIIISPILVSIIYIAMSIITLGVMSENDLTTLADVGKTFLSPYMLSFFIVCGPLIGVLTAMAPIIMFTSAQIQAAADCDLYPDFVKKTNRHGVSPAILGFIITLSIICIIIGIDYKTLLTVASFVQSVSSTLNCLVPFFLHKKYPLTCKNAGIKLNRYFVYIMCLFSFIYSGYLALSLLASLDNLVCTILGMSILVTFAYFLLRIKYLKSTGKNLIQTLKEPFSEWENYELQFKI